MLASIPLPQLSFAFAWTILLASVAQVQADCPASVHKYAVAIGISDYDPDQLVRVPLAENDASKFAELMIRAGSDTQQVKLLTNSTGAENPQAAPTKSNILGQLAQLTKVLTPDDKLMVAFSGHGLQSKSGSYFLCPLDADVEDVNTLISLEEIYRLVGECMANQKLLLIDAMQAEPFAKDLHSSFKQNFVTKLNNLPEPPANTAVFFSCSPEQSLSEASGPSNPVGYFFSAVISGVEGSAAGSDGSVTLSDVERYVKKQYTSNAAAAGIQPYIQKNFSGVFVLADHSLGSDEMEQIQNLIREDRYDEADKIVDRVLAAHPEDGRALAQRSRLMTYRAEQFRELSSVPEALQIAEAAVVAAPNDPLPYVARANAHRIGQKYEKAFADATKAVECDPNFVMAHVIRGFAYHHLHDLEGMGREAQIGIEIDPAHPEARAMFAAYYFAKGMIDEGLSHLERAIAGTKNMPALYFLKGYALEKKSLHHDAVAQFTLAIECNDQIPGYFCRRAISNANGGNYKAAMDDIAAAERIMPTYFDIASARAMVIQKQKGYGHAGHAIAEGLRANPKSADLWQGRGFDLYTNRQYTQAIDAFNKALEINPGYGEAHMGIGMVYLKLNKYDEALVHLNRATRHKEHLARAYFEKSEAYIAKGDFNAAFAELQLATKYDPSNGTFQSQLRTVQTRVGK